MLVLISKTAQTSTGVSDWIVAVLSWVLLLALILLVVWGIMAVRRRTKERGDALSDNSPNA